MMKALPDLERLVISPVTISPLWKHEFQMDYHISRIIDDWAYLSAHHPNNFIRINLVNPEHQESFSLAESVRYMGSYMFEPVRLASVENAENPSPHNVWILTKSPQLWEMDSKEKPTSSSIYEFQGTRLLDKTTLNRSVKFESIPSHGQVYLAIENYRFESDEAAILRKGKITSVTRFNSKIKSIIPQADYCVIQTDHSIYRINPAGEILGATEFGHYIYETAAFGKEIFFGISRSNDFRTRPNFGIITKNGTKLMFGENDVSDDVFRLTYADDWQAWIIHDANILSRYTADGANRVNIPLGDFKLRARSSTAKLDDIFYFCEGGINTQDCPNILLVKDDEITKRLHLDSKNNNRSVSSLFTAGKGVFAVLNLSSGEYDPKVNPSLIVALNGSNPGATYSIQGRVTSLKVWGDKLVVSVTDPYVPYNDRSGSKNGFNIHMLDLKQLLE